MSQELALILARFIAGIHSALVFYFLIGWLIPFAPLKKRALSSFIIGLIFLFFRFTTGCPLTIWQGKLRAIAEGTVYIDSSFVRDGLYLFSFSPKQGFIDISSLMVNVSIILITGAILLYTMWIQKSQKQS